MDVSTPMVLRFSYNLSGIVPIIIIIIVSITKFSIVIGSPRAYLSRKARVKNAVHMRVFPASGANLPLKLYAITKQTKFRPRNSKK